MRHARRGCLAAGCVKGDFRPRCAYMGACAMLARMDDERTGVRAERTGVRANAAVYRHPKKAAKSKGARISSGEVHTPSPSALLNTPGARADLTRARDLQGKISPGRPDLNMLAALPVRRDRANMPSSQLMPVKERRAKMFGRDALLAAGYTPKLMKKAVKRLDEALDAEHPSKVTTTETKDGTYTSTVEGGAPDHATRIKAIDRVFKVGDAVPRGKVDGADREPFTVELLVYDADGKQTAMRVSSGSPEGR